MNKITIENYIDLDTIPSLNFDYLHAKWRNKNPSKY